MGGHELFEGPGYSLQDENYFPRLTMSDELITQQLRADQSTAGRRELSTAQGGRLSIVLTSEDDGSLVAAQAASHPIAVSSSAGRWVLQRPTTRDVFVEVPASTRTCAYNTQCASYPLELVDVVLTNPHPTQTQTLRLSFSRNFETRAGLAQSGVGAEITGLSTQLWETSTRQATGIPMQIRRAQA